MTTISDFYSNLASMSHLRENLLDYNEYRDISTQHVNYFIKEKQILFDISLEFRSRQAIAIMGA